MLLELPLDVPLWRKGKLPFSLGYLKQRNAYELILHTDQHISTVYAIRSMFCKIYGNLGKGTVF